MNDAATRRLTELITLWDSLEDDEHDFGSARIRKLADAVPSLVAFARDVLALKEKYEWDEASNAMRADICDAAARHLGYQHD